MKNSLGLFAILLSTVISCKTTSSSEILADTGMGSVVVLSCESVKTILIKRETNGQLSVESFAPGGPKETDAEVVGSVDSSTVDLTITHHGVVLQLKAQVDASAPNIADRKDHTVGTLTVPGKAFPAKCAAEEGFSSPVAINVMKGP